MSKRGELTIGVTGRRHIVPAAVEAVERGARELLRAHVDAFDGPVRVCTGLAVGADSIMARIVLDEKKRRPAGKLRLAAVLPRALESYELDFKTAPDASGLSQRAAFRELLAQCDETVELVNAAEDAVGVRSARRLARRKLRRSLFVLERGRVDGQAGRNGRRHAEKITARAGRRLDRLWNSNAGSFAQKESGRNETLRSRTARRGWPNRRAPRSGRRNGRLAPPRGTPLLISRRERLLRVRLDSTGDVGRRLTR